MHFTFLPTFLFFFNKFRYLPSPIKYKYLGFSDQHPLRLLNSLFTSKGHKLLFTRGFLFIVRWVWFFSTNCFFTFFGGLRRDFFFIFHFFQKFIQPLTRLKFIFFFFFYKLNKLIYKYSNYKRPRYSLEFRYVPPYRRFKELFKYMKRSVVYYRGRTFKTKLYKLIWDFFFHPRELQFVRFVTSLQDYLFTHKRYLLNYK